MEYVKFVHVHQSVHLICILFLYVCLLQQQQKYNVPLLHTDTAINQMNY